VVLADGGGKPAPAGPVQAYVTKAFGNHLAEVRKVMEGLAARYGPEELNRVGFRLYVVRPVVETAGCAVQAAKGRLAGGH
jgi:hypothetical protein